MNLHERDSEPGGEQGERDLPWIGSVDSGHSHFAEQAECRIPFVAIGDSGRDWSGADFDKELDRTWAEDLRAEASNEGRFPTRNLRSTPTRSRERTMTRRTLVLSKEMDDEIQREARLRRKSFSEMARQLLERGLEADMEKPPLDLPFIGIGDSGDPDFAAKTDEYLAEHWERDLRKGWDD